MSFNISQSEIKDLDDAQQVAIIDAVVVAGWADGNVSQAEMARFETELGKVPWGKPQAALGMLVQSSVSRVRALTTPQAANAFLKQTATRLPTQSLREKVLYMMGAICVADGRITADEENALNQFALAFEVPKHRQQEIVKALLSAR